MSLAERRLLHRAKTITRRAARERRLALERELADYCTLSQCDDLEATLDQYPDGVTQELREILGRRRMAQEARRIPGIGREWTS